MVGDDSAGPVPEENQPGHRPEHDQDKPTGPPGGGRLRAAPRSVSTFRFAFSPLVAPFSALAGVLPSTARVEVDDDELRIDFGPWWRLRTPLGNVAGAEVTGPYQLVKVAGPPRLSLRDRGVTFATTTARGVCIRFHEPVPAIDPLGRIRHPAATVTVDDPDGLVAVLSNRLNA
jgi:hypothetical protein